MASRAPLGVHRLKTYKTRIAATDTIRAKREKEGIQLRKEKRYEQYYKRRTIETKEDKEILPGPEDGHEDTPDKNVPEENINKVKNKIPADNKVKDDIYDEEVIDVNTPLDKLANIVIQEIGETRFIAVSVIRRILSKLDPPIDDVIKTGVIPHLVDCVDPEESEELQMEAAWALTNVASGTSEQTAVVVHVGGVPRFIQLVQAQSSEIREQVLWALGNITGDCFEYRDLVIDFGIIPAIESIFNDDNEELRVTRQAAWLLSNLCRHKKTPFNQDILESIIPLFVVGFGKHEDKELLKDLCWGVSYLTEDGDEKTVQAVLDCGVLLNIIDLLESDNTKDIHAAVRFIGNITTGTDEQTQRIIDGGGLVILKSLLKHDKTSVQREACWAMSNITAGTIDQKQAVINNEIVPLLLDIVSGGEHEFKVMKEAIWAISNITENATDPQISYLVGLGTIQSLIGTLKLPNNEIIRVSLDGLLGILECGSVLPGDNPYGLMIHEIPKFVEQIESLQDHENHVISEKASKILDEYVYTFGNDNGESELVEEIAVEGNKNQFNINNQFK